MSKTGQGAYTYSGGNVPGGCTGTAVTRPQAVKTTAGNSGSYSYDCNGSMTAKTVGGVTSNLSWDVYGRLATTQVAAGTQTDIYGADGGRVVRVNPDGTKVLYLPSIELKSTPGASGAAPVHRATSQGSNAAGSTSVAVTRPAGTVAGDVLVASVTAASGSGSTLLTEGFEAGAGGGGRCGAAHQQSFP